ncbi:hypothetical protein KY290_005903 [Solanum tuberosum]|uniref:Cytochrome P450 n=2 Tax=Solanum tuberosum TaxID=4113 RepID=A0ABQ7WGV9_SOLTU|nr:hypothetical protein KY290_005903 [Solanum tuberosum]
MDMAREVLKTHDLAFASRPKLASIDIICYKSMDIAFTPYGEYWRQMRKVCVLELFTSKNVRYFSSIRRDEASRLVQFIRSSTRSEPINVTKRVSWYQSSNTCKAAFGELLKDQEKFIDQFMSSTLVSGNAWLSLHGTSSSIHKITRTVHWSECVILG